jgi:hypothetical protein
MRSHGLEFYTAPRDVDVEPHQNLQDNQPPADFAVF